MMEIHNGQRSLRGRTYHKSSRARPDISSSAILGHIGIHQSVPTPGL
jgi:hypothetical protein